MAAGDIININRLLISWQTSLETLSLIKHKNKIRNQISRYPVSRVLRLLKVRYPSLTNWQIEEGVDIFSAYLSDNLKRLGLIWSARYPTHVAYASNYWAILNSNSSANWPNLKCQYNFTFSDLKCWISAIQIRSKLNLKVHNSNWKSSLNFLTFTAMFVTTTRSVGREETWSLQIIHH